MKTNPDFEKMISEPLNAAILTALVNGRFFTSNELASMICTNPQLISSHLGKMVNKKVLTVKKSGSHYYFGIQNQEIKQEIESFLATSSPIKIKPIKRPKDVALLYARTCYHHLAGKIGVEVTDALLKLDYLQEDNDTFIVTDKGMKFFQSFQIDLEKVKSPSHRKCLDFSERRPHLAGALGNALLDRLLELKWIERMPNSRALTVTDTGKKGLQRTFSIN